MLFSEDQQLGKSEGRGTDKAKVFVAVSVTGDGKALHVKMAVTKDIKHSSVKSFAKKNIEEGTTIVSDGYCSYRKRFTGYNYCPSNYDSESGLLHCVHTVISNAKAFISGTYHGLPKKNLDEYIGEFCFRFSRRRLRRNIFDRLGVALVHYLTL